VFILEISLPQTYVHLWLIFTGHQSFEKLAGLCEGPAPIQSWSTGFTENRRCNFYVSNSQGYFFHQGTVTGIPLTGPEVIALTVVKEM
jgi:hypothetical protein